MKHILDAQSIKLWDRFTIENEPISSIDLMERAASACFDWLMHHFADSEFIVVCGTGNNGGDGLAIARKLAQNQLNVKVLVDGNPEDGSHDFKINLQKWLNLGFEISSNTHEFTETPADTIIVDALFGTGLNRPIEGDTANLIHQINQSRCKIIAIDMPSGLFADKHTPKTSAIIRANYTLSFQCPKLAFLLQENQMFVGQFHLLDIGLSPDFENLKFNKKFYLEAEDCKHILPKRLKHNNKWHFGHALLIGGSENKAGAILMASNAALRSGVGLLTVHTVEAARLPLLTTLPEAMLLIDSTMAYISDVPDMTKYKSIGIGPGLGTEAQTAKVLEHILRSFKGSLIIDADAINLIAEHQWQNMLPENTLLTPHVKEFERLAGMSENDFNRLELQLSFSSRYHVYVLLKGAFSSLSTPDGRLFFNSSGNPGMAKGGSGDSLTGIITALTAQGLTIEAAAKLGMMVHGIAGDLACQEFGETSMLPGDLIHALPEAFKQLA